MLNWVLLQNLQTGSSTLQINGICAKPQAASQAQLQKILILFPSPRISISKPLSRKILLSRKHDSTPKKPNNETVSFLLSSSADSWKFDGTEQPHPKKSDF
jgi:hypothetical protein